jgi:hypothetical protein
MIINKITPGFVTQTFNTTTKQFVSQTFTAGNTVDYEDQFGDTLSPEKMKQHGFGPDVETEPYLPFDMLQPSEIPFAGQKLGEKS